MRFISKDGEFSSSSSSEREATRDFLKEKRESERYEFHFFTVLGSLRMHETLIHPKKLRASLSPYAPLTHGAGSYVSVSAWDWAMEMELLDSLFKNDGTIGFRHNELSIMVDEETKAITTGNQHERR
ncbi:hypothetical protein DY000_02062477 [Brassica cretica]|uniref:Uncharacterized protein n=1 Tax=Brassica cretica TaxID=69181 RepID=A0ABQ7B2P0_BRACR|nr:hypothetical protein DY000_02062477 [Brassica cretica]